MLVHCPPSPLKNIEKKKSQKNHKNMRENGRWRRRPDGVEIYKVLEDIVCLGGKKIANIARGGTKKTLGIGKLTRVKGEVVYGVRHLPNTASHSLQPAASAHLSVWVLCCV